MLSAPKDLAQGQGKLSEVLVFFVLYVSFIEPNNSNKLLLAETDSQSLSHASRLPTLARKTKVGSLSLQSGLLHTICSNRVCFDGPQMSQNGD